jgi:O-acetyl-ADP-ribose deacetylase (regulator of RNase III)
VDGAIHRGAGPALLAACRALPEVQPGVRCPPGEARVTPGFGLKARYVIHAVGPVWAGGARGEAEVLARCYRSVLREVAALEVVSVALPAISTGAYGYPPDAAAEVAARETVAFAAGREAPLTLVFACLGPAMVARLERALTRAWGHPGR